MHIIFRCKTMLNFYIYVCILQASFFSLCVSPCQCLILLLVKEKRGSWLTFRKVWRLSLMQMTCAAFEQCFFVEASCRKSNSKSKPLPQVSLWHSSRKVSGIWNDKSAAHIVKYATSVACHTGTASWRTHLPNTAHPAHIHLQHTTSHRKWESSSTRKLSTRQNNLFRFEGKSFDWCCPLHNKYCL